MGYILIEIFACLLVASMLGGLIGYLLDYSNRKKDKLYLKEYIDLRISKQLKPNNTESIVDKDLLDDISDDKLLNEANTINTNVDQIVDNKLLGDEANIVNNLDLIKATNKKENIDDLTSRIEEDLDKKSDSLESFLREKHQKLLYRKNLSREWYDFDQFKKDVIDEAKAFKGTDIILKKTYPNSKYSKDNYFFIKNNSLDKKRLNYLRTKWHSYQHQSSNNLSKEWLDFKVFYKDIIPLFNGFDNIGYLNRIDSTLGYQKGNMAVSLDRIKSNKNSDNKLFNKWRRINKSKLSKEWLNFNQFEKDMIEILESHNIGRRVSFKLFREDNSKPLSKTNYKINIKDKYYYKELLETADNRGNNTKSIIKVSLIKTNLDTLDDFLREKHQDLKYKNRLSKEWQDFDQFRRDVIDEASQFGDSNIILRKPEFRLKYSKNNFYIIKNDEASKNLNHHLKQRWHQYKNQNLRKLSKEWLNFKTFRKDLLPLFKKKDGSEYLSIIDKSLGYIPGNMTIDKSRYSRPKNFRGRIFYKRWGNFKRIKNQVSKEWLNDYEQFEEDLLTILKRHNVDKDGYFRLYRRRESKLPLSKTNYKISVKGNSYYGL